jgi:UDP-glucose 4-epimerase
MASYLVTGGAGFVGSHLVKGLLAKGHSVRVLDDLSTGRAENVPGDVQLIISSVTDPVAVRSALDGIDGCFHLAAIASVELSNREWLRSHTVNLSGAIAIFEEINRAQVDRGQRIPVVYASSAAVYGNQREVPISETNDLHPINAYGADKLGCELHAAVAARVFNIPNIGLRFFNIYGPGQDPNSPYSGVISIFCERFLAGSSIEIHGDGSQVRDFIYVEDVVNALLLGMEKADANHQVFNVCTGSGTTVLELAKIIAEICGTPFSVRHGVPRAADIRASIGDPRRANDKLNFSARTPIRDGLARMIKTRNTAVVHSVKPYGV